MTVQKHVSQYLGEISKRIQKGDKFTEQDAAELKSLLEGMVTTAIISGVTVPPDAKEERPSDEDQS